ncbi:RBBP9/YdeN family alpha/beta hydrolase [Crenobacter cavernae]|uniref:Alpha/beta hydrolase n=1 Tax=Crenobacter cavernae TaxID=2290923 RepID=A0A345Y441_9NEIS|nr:alpha/beta hydrolase [Crenobacter cavernae]AXK38693.1 alpha/beta hydrolase [Crenobacter cavernae]
MANRILIVPGIGNSGPEHWQSLWEKTNPAFTRVAQRDWERPVRAEWVAALDAAVAASGPNTLLVAHSLGCLAVAHWAATTRRTIRGALLVAVPDPNGPAFPAEAAGFTQLPRQRLGFDSIVVASEDDPYGSADFAAGVAGDWGSRFVKIGARGHLNAASGLGVWPEGLVRLSTLKGYAAA